MTQTARKTLLAVSADLIVLLVTVVSASAQVGQPLQCIANAAVPPTLRSEGLTELVGDIVINCTGGTPTPSGQLIPQANVSLALNAQISSKILNPLTGASEALLLIDEPRGPSNPNATQLICGSLDGCTVTGNGTGDGVFDGSSGRPNIFQGVIAGNSVTFNGVPIEAPSKDKPRIFRITNVRANVAGLTSGLLTNPTPVTGSVSFLPMTPRFVPPVINNSRLTLGNAQPSLNLSVLNQQTVPNCLPLNSTFFLPTPPAVVNPIILNYRELFPSAFKTRSAPGLAGQNIPGQIYNSESGFFFDPNTPQGKFTSAGLADWGTRLKAVFNNIPPGATLWVTTTNTSSTGIPMTPSAVSFAQLLTSETAPYVNGLPPTVPAAGTSGAAQVPIVNGSGTAVWEIINTNPGAAENFNFGVFLAFQPGPNQNATQPPFTVNVVGGFGGGNLTSDSPGLANGNFLIPRFIDQASLNPFFNSAIATIAPCTGPATGLTALLPPGQTNGLHFDSFGGILSTPPPLNIFISNNTVDTQNNGGDSGGGSYPIAPGGFRTETYRTQDFSYQVKPTATATSDRNWLKVASSGGSSPTTFTVTANPAGLPPGNYTGSISVNALAQNSLTSTVSTTLPATLTVASPGPVASTAGFVSATTYQGSFAVPGMPLVIFGSGFGASSLTGLTLTPDNTTISNSVANTRVLFDGAAAPMIYSANGQISTIVPFELAGKGTTQAVVEYNGVQAPPVTLPVLAAAPGLFTANASGTGPGAILNVTVASDGSTTTSYNSPSNPAPAGSIVTLYASGAGQTDPPGKTGHLASVPLPKPVLPVTAFIDGVQADVLYAGSAPGLFEGVLQVNVRIPTTVKPGNRVVVLKVGSTQTPPWATVSVSAAQ